MRTGSQTPRRGSSALEFTLVGIPLIFILISTFEIARGMWTYHTLAYAVKEGTRYMIVHGANCGINGNTCTVTVGQIAQRIHDAGVGLVPSGLTLTFTANSSTVTCQLSNCLNDTTVWPPSPNNTRGSDVQIRGVYPFNSALALFWPGAGRVSFNTVNFPASSREIIQF